MQMPIINTQQIANKLKWWQIALISVAVSLLGKLAGGNDTDEQKLYTKQLKQGPWAPPAWLFGPAWTINNFFLLIGLRRLYTNEQMPERRKLLILQAMLWVIFFSFSYVYFRKKSTVLAAIWTMSDAIFATASFMVANKVDKKVSMTYLPLTAWTLFASTLAGYQALKNPDKALGTPALLN
ncbi:MAG: TspO/MBR family protein [Flavipsychrobacter sp.]|nr:TspO/MBR family protein [Flavipsychrobacter sp.]